MTEFSAITTSRKGPWLASSGDDEARAVHLHDIAMLLNHETGIHNQYQPALLSCLRSPTSR